MHPQNISYYFKKASSLCGNYRIRITDALFKVYDRILLNRLTTWYISCQEQAGYLKGKSCFDHILTLRLLGDYVIIFIDFEKAYDEIPRGKPFEEMKRLGCGRNFSSNIKAMYRSTKWFLNERN